MNAPRLGLYATVVSLSVTSWAGAQTVYNWDPPPHANVFSTSTNWTPVGPPGTTGEARFNTSASSYSVAFSTDPTNARVHVGNDHVTFNLNGHTYTLTTTSTSSPSIMVGGITIVDDALLTVTDGTLAGQHAVIAPATLQTAAGMVVSTGGALNLAGTFTIGKQRPGSLTVQNGGDVTSATGVLGESGAGDGSVTVTGAGSTWTNSGSVYVGGQAAIDGGSGTLSINNQGLVDVGGTLKLWPGGDVALNGGTLETEILELAGGTFNWTSGSLRFSSDLSVDPSGPLGGAVAVGGGKYLSTGGNLDVGDSGNGTLGITAGGAVFSQLSSIGALAGSTGTATVDGVGSQWINQHMLVGNGGSGTLHVSNGGLAHTIGGDSGNGVIGNLAGSAGLITVDGAGSTWNVSSTVDKNVVIVGNNGDGTLEITNGAGVGIFSTGSSVNFATFEIGRQGGSTGIVTVDGSGSYLNVESDSLMNNSVQVGVLGGNGTLNVTNGGKVQTTCRLRLGAGGTLNITGGGQVTNHGGSIFGTPGTTTVDGAGSTWKNDASLAVSRILTVTNGGMVQATTLTVNASGRIRGDGSIVGNVVSTGEVQGGFVISGDLQNNGLTSPGMSAGALTVNGDYSQSAGGQLLIELASASSYDQLLVSGEATLAGALQVSLLGGFTPSIGQSFTILTSPDVSFTFGTEMLPSVPGRIFDVLYNATSVVLTVLPAFSADFDEDGDVDGDDLAQWRGDFGMNGDSDADHDGDSDGVDFLGWQRQVGSPLVIAAAVPEPSAVTLVALASCSLARSRKRYH